MQACPCHSTHARVARPTNALVMPQAYDNSFTEVMIGPEGADTMVELRAVQRYGAAAQREYYDMGIALHGSSTCAQGSLEHAPAASACSADCCALPAARRSRAVDIVDIFLQRIDGNRKRLEEASGSARALASTGCNHRPSGTSGGSCGPAGAIGGVCACVPGVGPGGAFTTLRMST